MASSSEFYAKIEMLEKIARDARAKGLKMVASTLQELRTSCRGARVWSKKVRTRELEERT